MLSSARYRISTGFAFACRALAVLATALAIAPAHADDDAFLQRFTRIATLASTVPANQDVNPYGIAFVEQSVGSLQRGDILVSNFNNAANLQGTGTTIVRISSEGNTSVFAQFDPAELAASCPGGVGLTTALAVLRRGWVIVGSLPSASGLAADAHAGCLIVTDASGHVVETFAGDGIDGPWDMAVRDDGEEADLFVSNVLNGNVTTGPAHEVDQGTVLRIRLAVPLPGDGLPRRRSTTLIGSEFPETADPAALVIGPTGLGLGWDGTLYVADTLGNRIAAIDAADTRETSARSGRTVAHGGALAGPLGLVVAPNGNILTTNAGDGNIVETTPAGAQAAVRALDTATGAGSLFGMAILPRGRGLAFVDDGDNTVKLLMR